MENLFTEAELTELRYGAVAWSIFILYFLPTVIAIFRKHNSFGSILVINFFLGWTFIGWVGALASSLSGQKKSHTRNKKSLVNQLELLSRLKEKGHLSDKEYARQKRKLLD